MNSVIAIPTRDIRGKRVIVGLSGGVDSAVAALLLKDQGADVQALHMTNWEDEDGYCTAAADLQDARRVCEHLQIPLHHVNFAREYRNLVFADFLKEYRAGRTPNPDVLCNREIKFGVFRQYAKRLGGELLATGHYARVRPADGKWQLWKAADANKDQSYFLHAIPTSALAETIFPLGEMIKDEVRELARDRGLAVFDKRDSTGICFIGERPFRQFLAQYLAAEPGPVKTTEGRTIGEHHGLMYYTYGQRKGLGIGGLDGASDDPWYVADKRAEDNALIVVQGDDPLLYSDALVAINANWIGETPVELSKNEALTCQAKIRYRQADQDCTVRRTGSKALTVCFDTPQRAVAPGQSIVFYHDEQCLGGAIIDSPHRNTPALRAAI